MGYDVHITRRKHWSDRGADIAASEWQHYVRQDAELRLSAHPENGPHFAEWHSASGAGWLDWTDGRIYSKNPEPALIEKMLAIARHFGASVQGDDGEVYTAPGQSSEKRTGSPVARALAWLSRLGKSNAPAVPAEVIHAAQSLGFRVGDTVVDPWGNEHVVLAIDPAAERGLGVIRTRRRDGTLHAGAILAHGFKRSDGTAHGGSPKPGA